MRRRRPAANSPTPGAQMNHDRLDGSIATVGRSGLGLLWRFARTRTALGEANLRPADTCTCAAFVCGTAPPPPEYRGSI